MNLKKKAKRRFEVATRMELDYRRAIRKLTQQINHMIKGMQQPDGTIDTGLLNRMLRKYSETIQPWAESVASKMIAKVAAVNESNWIQSSQDLGKELKKELQTAPTAQFFAEMKREQVKLITSLPIEAAERVHHLVMEAQLSGKRADEIAKEILRTGEVTSNRAKLIARTEVARTAASLTQVRAKHIGSTHYIWRTSQDGDVRESHKKMANKVIAWDSPPEVDPGKRYHAGMFPNCRCYPEPIINE